MSELVADCPRCGAQQITFDLAKENLIDVEYQWKHWYEAFCICRHCKKATIFRLEQRLNAKIPDEGVVSSKEAVNRFLSVDGYICIKHIASRTPPEHLPKDIEAAFKEGVTCLSVQCYNAAAAMFRLCIDFASDSRLPKEGDEKRPNNPTCRSLGLRLEWLFNNGYLPKELRELSTCIKEDGNDGAHEGTLSKADAEDLLDFTEALLERLYTEPERLRLAELRRKERRSGKT
ncbi:MAG: DUF4145 domain-containing protein [Bacillota bacterium]